MDIEDDHACLFFALLYVPEFTFGSDSPKRDCRCKSENLLLLTSLGERS